MFRTPVFKPFSSISEALNNQINSLKSFFLKPYADLVAQATEIINASLMVFNLPEFITWESVIDTETGLRIMKAEKNPLALNDIRQIADELFK